MPQIFKLAILDMNNRMVEVPLTKPEEKDFISAIVERVGKKDVGALKTQAQVLKVLGEELQAAFSELKFETRKVL